MQDEPTDIPYGYCHCGCGQRTKVPAKSNKSKGQVRGVPLKYVHTHNCRALRKPFETLYERGAEDACWEWQGSRSAAGYGMYSWRGLYAHRVAYEQANGPIPDGKHILHECDNPPCVNPKHLRVGSHQENVRDMIRKNRHAQQGGYKLSPEQVREIRTRWANGGVQQG